MELFDVKGCLSEEGLQALVSGQLDETQRLEAAEHLAYCDRCMDRYTALLTDDVLEQPPRSARGAVMGTIWIRLMQNTWGRAAVATVAAVLALTMWRAGTLEQILHTGQQLNTWLPQTTQQTEPELLGKPVNDKAPQPSTAPLGKPIEDKKQLTEKLSDALDGLRFLCALPNMETHADLIAGLPLYHLHEIFEDVRTLAEYAAGEIQLESLKLLPGTEMRRRAEESGIKYSPLPPYEVLQTHEINVSELQTARQLSRLLDGFYNTPAWQALTRELILNDEQFLHRFLTYLTKANLIDQPMSLEKRGLILYEFCKQNYPEYQIQASIAWIEAGMSLKKLPAEKVWTKRQIPPATWNIIYGEYKESLRLCFLPADEKGEHGYWFGFESEIQKASPVFKART